MPDAGRSLRSSTHERVPAVAARLDCPVYAGGDEVRQVVSRLGVPSSDHRPVPPPAATVRRRTRRPNARRLVVVEGVDNPSNIGSIIRNAAALGWDGLILDHTSADPLARRSLRVGDGDGVLAPPRPHRHPRRRSAAPRRTSTTTP